MHVRYINQEKEVYAFFDQGSMTCFCETLLADSLKAAGRKHQLTLCTLITLQFLNTVSLHLSVQGLNEGKWIDLPDVLVVDKILAKPNDIPDSQVLNKY